MAVLVVVAMALVVGCSRSGGDERTSVDGSSSQPAPIPGPGTQRVDGTLPAYEGPGATPGATDDPPTATAGIEEPSTPITVGDGTDAPLVCRNSFDPRCGPLYWDPTPVNQPPSITVTFDPATPIAGEPVAVHLELRDPDALGGSMALHSDGCRQLVPPFEHAYDRVVCQPFGMDPGHNCNFVAYGGWSPPVPIGGTPIADSYVVVFDQPGWFSFDVVWEVYGPTQPEPDGRTICGPEGQSFYPYGDVGVHQGSILVVDRPNTDVVSTP